MRRKLKETLICFGCGLTTAGLWWAYLAVSTFPWSAIPLSLAVAFAVNFLYFEPMRERRKVEEEVAKNLAGGACFTEDMAQLSSRDAPFIYAGEHPPSLLPPARRGSLEAQCVGGSGRAHPPVSVRIDLLAKSVVIKGMGRMKINIEIPYEDLLGTEVLVPNHWTALSASLAATVANMMSEKNAIENRMLLLNYTGTDQRFQSLWFAKFVRSSPEEAKFAIQKAENDWLDELQRSTKGEN